MNNQIETLEIASEINSNGGKKSDDNYFFINTYFVSIVSSPTETIINSGNSKLANLYKPNSKIGHF